MSDQTVSKRFKRHKGCTEVHSTGKERCLPKKPALCSGRCRVSLEIHNAPVWQDMARVAVGRMQTILDAVVVRWYEIVTGGTEVLYTETVANGNVRETTELMELIAPQLSRSEGFWGAFNSLVSGETDEMHHYSAHHCKSKIDSNLGSVDVGELVCFQGYHSGSGAVAVVVGFASKKAAREAHGNLHHLRKHIRVASDKLMRMASQYNLTTALSSMREKSDLVGLSIVGSEVGRLWDVDEVSRLLLRELGVEMDESSDNVHMPIMFSNWIQATLKGNRRLCADPVSSSKMFRSPRGKKIEARLFVEQVGSGGILVLRHSKQLEEFGGVFTRRELDVVHCLMRGLPSQDTALQLDISKRTVDKHLENIYQKLGVSNRLKAVGMLHQMEGAMGVNQAV